MEKISALLVNSVMTAQGGGVKGEVNTSIDADKRKIKMAEVAVLLKRLICKRSKRSKKNNGIVKKR